MALGNFRGQAPNGVKPADLPEMNGEKPADLLEMNGEKPAESQASEFGGLLSDLLNAGVITQTEYNALVAAL